MGISYDAKTAILTLQADVAIDFHGSAPATLTAASGTIAKDPRVVVLDLPRMRNAFRSASADKGTLFLRADNTVDRILAAARYAWSPRRKLPQSRMRPRYCLRAERACLCRLRRCGKHFASAGGPEQLRADPSRSCRSRRSGSRARNRESRWQHPPAM